MSELLGVEDEPKKGKSEKSSGKKDDDSKLLDGPSGGSGCSCKKILFTIIPILPIWWVIKLILKIVWYPINVILWPFRFVFGSCSANINKDFLPEWRFPDYDF